MALVEPTGSGVTVIAPGSGPSSTNAATQPPSSTAAASRIPFQRVCLLDPKATKILSPSDADLFDCFLYGGILGDDPPRDRTAELRKLGFEGRHLGEKQMTTDTAVGVTKMVVEDGSESLILLKRCGIVLMLDDEVPLDQVPYTVSPLLFFAACLLPADPIGLDIGLAS